LFVFTPARRSVRVWMPSCGEGRHGASRAGDCRTSLTCFPDRFLSERRSSRNFGERRYVDVSSSRARHSALLSRRCACSGCDGVRLAVGASLLIAGLGAIAPFGGAAGQGGSHMRPQTSGHRSAESSASGRGCPRDHLALGLVLWLMRGGGSAVCRNDGRQPISASRPARSRSSREVHGIALLSACVASAPEMWPVRTQAAGQSQRRRRTVG